MGAILILASVFAVAAFPQAAAAQVPQPPPNGNCQGTAVLAKLSVVEDQAAANMLAEAVAILGLGQRCLVDAGGPTSGRVPPGSRNELSNADRVFVVGGPAAIPHDWLTSTLGVSNYTRIAGGNRWDTQSAVVSAIFSLARGAPVVAFAGQPSSTPDLPPNTGCTNAVAVKLNVIEDTAAANMLAEAFDKLSDGGDDRCLVDVGDPRAVTTPTSRAKDDYDYAEAQYVIGGTTAIPNSWLSTHFGERNYERLAGADRWGTQAAVARIIVELIPPLVALSDGADVIEHVSASGESILGNRQALEIQVEDATLFVFWCGQRDEYSHREHSRQVNEIEVRIRSSRIFQQLANAGIQLTFVVGDPLFPPDWQQEGQSITSWSDDQSQEDPCTDWLVPRLNNIDGATRRNSLILADVVAGSRMDPDSPTGFSATTGFAYNNEGGPAVMPTRRMWAADRRSENEFYVVFAHELGHTIYDLPHVWGSSNSPPIPCDDSSELSLDQRASIMSYTVCMRRKHIEQSYIACVQLNELATKYRLPEYTPLDCDGSPPPPVPEPRVELTIGRSAQGEIGCSSVHCRRLVVDIDEKAIADELGSGPHTVVCAHEAFREYGRGAWYSTSASSFPHELGCYFGYPGVDVFVIVGAKKDGNNWVGGVYSETLRWPDCQQEPNRCPGPKVQISWGTDGSNRSSCPAGIRCTNLAYQIEGLGNGPWRLNCGDDAGGITPFLWSGNPATGCWFSGTSGNAGNVWVEVDGHRSNSLPRPTRPR